jgi:ribose-phosphate pyrophosphokinase
MDQKAAVLTNPADITFALGARSIGNTQMCNLIESSGFKKRQTGSPIIASCHASVSLAEKVTRLMLLNQEKIIHLSAIDFSFSDSETCVRLPSDVSNSPVYLFQSLYDPNSHDSIDKNYFAFLLAIRALKEWGASSVTGVIPYLAYARQDHTTLGEMEPISARLLADMSSAAGLDRLITFKPHSEATEIFYRDNQITIDQIDCVNFFASVFSPFSGKSNTILIAPDTGSAQFVSSIGQSLDLRTALVRKFRPRAEECIIQEIIGDFSGITDAIILDDMVSSAGTVYNLIKQLKTEHQIDSIYLGVAHNLCFDMALERLIEMNSRFGLKKMVTTNSIPQTPNFASLPFMEVIDISDLLARQISFNIAETSCRIDFE